MFGRRHLLKTVGAWLSVAMWTPSRFASLLDRVFGSIQVKRTSPITPIEEFYVTSYRSPPTIHLREWTLSVTGLVTKPTRVTYDELLALPRVSRIVTLECVGNTVGGELIGTAEWVGVPLRLLLEEAEIDPLAIEMVVRGADGYFERLPLNRVLGEDVLIAHQMNGVPLPLGHGFPARLIVPGHYGMKSVQWLTELELVSQKHKGYYALKGWTDEAVVKTTSRIDFPGHGMTIHGLRQRVTGWAFSGARGIVRVEVSTDGGGQWHEAMLAALLSAHAWQFWVYEWIVPKPGEYTLAVRATDGTGRVQTAIEQDPAPDGAAGIHEVIVLVQSALASMFSSSSGSIKAKC